VLAFAEVIAHSLITPSLRLKRSEASFLHNQVNPLEQNRLDEARAKAEFCKREFSWFVREAWHTLEPTTPFKAGIHSDCLIEHCQSVRDQQIKRLLISMPPRFGKSLITSVLLPLWVWCTHPSARFLAVSHKYELAQDLSIKTRRVFTSDWYQQNFGFKPELALVRDTIEVIENAATGKRQLSAFESATGMGAATPYGSLIIDDAHSPGTLSDEVRRQALETYDSGLSNRVSDNASIIVVGQRLHSMDLIGYLMDRGGFEVIQLPNEYDPKRSTVTSIGWKDPRTEENQLLWPDVFGPKETLEAKRQGSFRYSVSVS
jgi:hypothetical protein